MKWDRMLELAALRRAGALSSPSRFQAEETARELGRSAEGIHIVPNPLPQALLTMPPADPAASGPEEPVQGGECRSWTFPLEHGNLLTKGEDVEGGVASTAEEDTDHGEDGEDELEHEPILLT